MEAAVGTLKMCQQAQDQLQNAINTVVKAEQQLRENTREVRKVTLPLSLLFLKFPSLFLAYENMSIMSAGLSQLLKNRVHPGLCVPGKTNSNKLGLGLSVILSHRLC